MAAELEIAETVRETWIGGATGSRPAPWTAVRTGAAAVEIGLAIAAFPIHREAVVAAHSVVAAPVRQGPAVRVDRPALAVAAEEAVEAVDAAAVGDADSCLRIGADT